MNTTRNRPEPRTATKASPEELRAFLQGRGPCAFLDFEFNRFHPTQKPVALLEDLIQTFSRPGDLVVDFTAGSFSTGVAALRTGRRFVGVERDPGFFEIGVRRLQELEA